jgi:putative membrane protein
MRTSKLTFYSLLVLPLTVAACSHEGRPARTTGYEPGMTPASRSAPSAPDRLGNEPSEKLDDAQIASVLRAANAAEVDQAKVAVGKASDPAVKNFAQTMIADHGQAVKDIDELDSRLGWPDADSQLATELRISATRLDNDLAAINDQTFDKRYILGQIDEHRKVLDTIDTRLTPAAQRDELKQLITNMRPRVAHHLQMAQTILDSMK